MSNFKLSVGFRNAYNRTNEETGKTYKVRCYYVFGKNNPLAVAQLEQDIKDAGYNVIRDEKAENTLIFRTTRGIIPAGCQIVRTKDGKWVADTEELQEIEALGSKFPMMAKQAMDEFTKKINYVNAEVRRLKAMSAVEETETEGDGDADPFN